MVIDATGTTAKCPYCGSGTVLDHRDTDYYRDFYERMRGFFKLSADGQERRLRADELWNSADEEEFECSDGRRINVRSMHIYTDRTASAYTARQSLIFRFAPDKAECADRFRRAVSSLDYPSADTKSLSDFFPRISGGFELADGSALLALKKSEDEYPLRLFGALGGRHAAWIVSRLENLCCVLEYNSLVHAGIGIDNLYINPYDHVVCLYGGWWNAVPNNTVVDGRARVTRDNLYALREVAAAVLGFRCAAEVKARPDLPQPFADFIKGAPESNAYDDFALWDEVLIKSYGERRFVNMDTDDEQIYGKGT
jgi:hypothetical protein